ncbi:thioredoxin family protein [Pseudomonas sp. H1h]|uniref:DUF899 domain-containing protein n=1 Tax=Pseudomonas sp. H1h TaxID=1397280 RepID=UPI00046A16AB|nr:thioredoxin family protein [Pseudomonas sp. H1h]
MNIENHPVVSREEWLAARKQHLADEKAFTRERDRLSARRRALPWVKVDEDYRFHGPNGELKLADLFGKHSQLIVYHFMFAKDWEEGCQGCSFLSDHIDGVNQHLAHHDIAVVAVSHAPFGQFQAFKRRMGWKFDWVSSDGSDFNYDFGVCAREGDAKAGKATYNYEKTDSAEEEMPGLSVFYRNQAGEIFHTYSTYARGLDMLVGAYNYLDLTPKGRNEDEIMEWVRHHDQYERASKSGCCHGGE